MLSTHWRAVLQALFVTFLWSTSWVFIKIGLDDIPALTFAGLRYTLAAGILAAYAFRSAAQRQALRALSRRDWAWLILLGLVFYTINQGGVFLGLVYLPAVTFSLILNFTAVVTALMGIFWLREIPNGLQWAGIVVFLGGVLVYFYPVDIPTDQVIGLLIAVGTVIATAAATVIGRYINSQNRLSPLLITTTSMTIGSVLLLLIGAWVQGVPRLSLQSWAIVAWLAVVNTAFAFTLWNHIMRTLSSLETSIINNTMLVQIAVLAWVFLGEHISGREVIGLALAMVGVLLVQLRWPLRGGQPKPVPTDDFDFSPESTGKETADKPIATRPDDMPSIGD